MTSEGVRRYVMIGAPVTSVRTPPLLEAFLAGEGVVARVEVLHLEPDGLDGFMDGMRADRGVDGLMVTMPHKRAVLDHLDAISAVAAEAGSVNAVRRVGKWLLGAQFDGMGLVSAAESAGAVPPQCRVWLKGLGGAGLAIAQALLARGVERLFITEADAARLASVGPLGAAVILAPHDIVDADVLVNATPLGMRADDPSPFTRAQVRGAAVVADIVADPNRTLLAEYVREAGGRLVTGRQMVEHQVPLIGRWLLGDGPEQDPAP